MYEDEQREREERERREREERERREREERERLERERKMKFRNLSNQLNNVNSKINNLIQNISRLESTMNLTLVLNDEIYKKSEIDNIKKSLSNASAAISNDASSTLSKSY